jgi:two-component system nitrate/nitrite response regulator NarL
MKLLIVDDHSVLREGLAALLKLLGSDILVVQSRNAEEGLVALSANPDLDVIVLDLVMPGTSGLEALSLFRRQRPDIPIVVLSSSEEPKDVRSALAAGAMGYVPKSANHNVLLSAIKLAMNGEFYIPPLILEQGSMSQVDAGIRTSSGNDTRLTERQIEVLSLLSQGKPNKSIATALGLSEKTVKTHITAIFKALNVVNRTQAAAAARLAGLI